MSPRFGLGAVGSNLLVCLSELAERDGVPVRFSSIRSIPTRRGMRFFMPSGSSTVSWVSPFPGCRLAASGIRPLIRELPGGVNLSAPLYFLR